MTAARSSITVRRFETDEWGVLRQVRLAALQSDPRMFGSTHAAEAAFTEADWRSQLDDRDVGVFGLFDGEGPVGMGGIKIDEKDPTKQRPSCGAYGSIRHIAGKG